MEIDIAGMKASLDARRMMVRIHAPAPEGQDNGTTWEKQGIEVVLLFGILAALTKPTGKTK